MSILQLVYSYLLSVPPPNIGKRSALAFSAAGILAQRFVHASLSDAMLDTLLCALSAAINAIED